ncbi:MAG: CDP-glucose 4,6-dehydratase [Candidatus Omnitrophica bacterium]|nr:CDP-glucose 4,6-dehydratase [Candidatus Omnitrophota bacterium]
MKKTLKNFYKGKRVLLTGHTGFKGGWLSLWLLKLGANVGGYALKPSSNSGLYKVLGLERRMESVTGDVRNKKEVQSLFKEFRPEIVIHMAAQALVRRSYEDPVTTLETNIMGTVNVLEACRNFPSVRSIINVTSDKCYENHGRNRAYRENDPMGGHDPYSSSKGCSELVTAAYIRSFFNPQKYGKDHKTALASVRAGNVIGGGDWSKDRIIPDCVRAVLSSESLVIRYPQAIRPWQHVLEPLYGYLLLAKKLYQNGPAFSGAWNFGPRKKSEKPVKWIVEEVNELWDGRLSVEVEKQRQPHESICLRLNSKKSESLLGWHPKMELAYALKETVEWYKAWHKNQDMWGYSVNQVENYMSEKRHE